MVSLPLHIGFHYLLTETDVFGIEYIPQEVVNKIRDKSVTHNIFRIQDMILLCVDFIAFIEYMLSGETLLDYTNLFSLNDYKKDDKIKEQIWQKKNALSLD